MLSSAREEQLAVLCKKENTLGIWVSNKIDESPETKNVSWNMLFTVDLTLNKFGFRYTMTSLMVDVENKVIVFCVKKGKIIRAQFFTLLESMNSDKWIIIFVEILQTYIICLLESTSS